MLRYSLLSLSLLFASVTCAGNSAAQEEWKEFLAKPSSSAYKMLSKTIQLCAATKCQEKDVAGSSDNCSSLYKLLELVEHGNRFAIEIAFQIRPLYEDAAAPSEDIDRSIGLSASLEPALFLELVQEYRLSDKALEYLVVQTSVESIDSLGEHRAEWKRRIQSLSKVVDPRLLPLRARAISFVQQEIDETSTLPDDALGKPSAVQSPKSVLLGVLEDVPGKYAGQPNSRHIRMVFEKEGDDWQPFPANCPDQACLKTLPLDFPSQVNWTIAFDGRNLGQVTTHVPKAYDFYMDAGLQDITSEGPIPTIGQRAEEYGGFLFAPVFRPLIANSQPYFRDPESWKPVHLPAGLVASLRQQFRKQFPEVQNCASPEENVTRTWQYHDQDIEIHKAYSSNKKWVLAPLRLGGYRCDGPQVSPSQDAFSDQWFVIDPENHIELLGKDMWLVDAGDYDNDGKSEIVFAITGYNKGGYELFYDDFKKHVEFEFGYQ
jgi:hypothetical protein